jgi:DNA-directed RNA polymerase subunit H (RpoH/RPB5)
MKIKRGGVTAKMMNKVNHFFTLKGNKGDVISEEDKNAVLEKYGLKIDDVIKYDKRDGNS